MNSIELKNEAELMDYAGRLAVSITPPFILFLSGRLGAGKTTFVRGFLRGLGYEGTVKSPTFTLVEEYDLQDKKIYHFDLYRISDPEELEAMGMRDYFDNAIVIVEWPERAANYLPAPDLSCYLEVVGLGRRLVF